MKRITILFVDYKKYFREKKLKRLKKDTYFKALSKLKLRRF